MALAENELDEIAKLLAAPGAEAETVAELRRRFRHLSWTRCDASDMTEPPFRRCGRFDLHLLDTSDHCAQVTTDPARTTGVILARRSVP